MPPIRMPTHGETPCSLRYPAPRHTSDPHICLHTSAEIRTTSYIRCGADHSAYSSLGSAWSGREQENKGIGNADGACYHLEWATWNVAIHVYLGDYSYDVGQKCSGLIRCSSMTKQKEWYTARGIFRLLLRTCLMMLLLDKIVSQS